VERRDKPRNSLKKTAKKQQKNSEKTQKKREKNRKNAQKIRKKRQKTQKCARFVAPNPIDGNIEPADLLKTPGNHAVRRSCCCVSRNMQFARSLFFSRAP
jgi:hypothetical protein